MAKLFFCTVSSVDYDNATADIAIPDHEDMVKTNIPILDTVYNMPEIGETVAALFNVENGRLERGVILGRPYHQTNVMDVSAQTMKVKQLKADSIIYKDSCEKG